MNSRVTVLVCLLLQEVNCVNCDITSWRGQTLADYTSSWNKKKRALKCNTENICKYY